MVEIKKHITLKGMISIALPLMVSQGTETIMMFTDRLFLSRLGKEFLSASMSGGISSLVFTSFFIGLIGYVTAIVAQYYGAGQEKNCIVSTGQAIWLSFISYPLVLCFIPVVRHFFFWMEHTPDQVVLEFTYFRLLMCGSLLVFLRNAVGGYFIGTGRTSKVMASNIIGMAVNIPLNWVLIFGKLGVPALGITGAAYGTMGGSLASCIYLFINFSHSCEKKKVSVFNNWNGEMMKRLLRFGAPAGGEFFANMFLFNFFIQLMHSYSIDVASAVTITFNYNMVAFIPMLGLNVAITSVTGQQMGAGSIIRAKRVARLGGKIAYFYGGLMVLLFLSLAPWMVKFFVKGFSDSGGTVHTMATYMLRLGALYILADATQLIFSGVLKGAGDTRWVMIISISLHMLMAFAAFLMVKVLKTDPMTVWYMFIGFVIALGLAMFLRYFSGGWQKIKMIELKERAAKGTVSLEA